MDFNVNIFVLILIKIITGALAWCLILKSDKQYLTDADIHTCRSLKNTAQLYLCMSWVCLKHCCCVASICVLVCMSVCVSWAPLGPAAGPCWGIVGAVRSTWYWQSGSSGPAACLCVQVYLQGSLSLCVFVAFVYFVCVCAWVIAVCSEWISETSASPSFCFYVSCTCFSSSFYCLTLSLVVFSFTLIPSVFFISLVLPLTFLSKFPCIAFWLCLSPEVLFMCV